jgi:hypothetical protein
MSDDSRISPRYALLVPGWLKWFGASLAAFILGVLLVTSVAVLIKGSLWGLALLPMAAYFGWITRKAFWVFRDPAASYVELTDDGLIVRPLFTLGGPLNVRYTEIESLRLAGDCGWSFLQYPYPLTVPHIDVRLARLRLIVGYRSFRWAKMLHLNVGEPERFLAELSARTGR